MAAFKVNITKNGNAIKFQFTDSDHYLYGNGVVEVPVNSLSLVIDESDFVTFKKASTNDTFITFDPANSNLSDKAGVIEFYKENMVGSTGGDGSGVTPSEVQEMIDESLDDYYTDDEVDAALSGKASASDVTAVASDVSTVSGQVATKVAITDFNTYSAATDARLAEDEEVTAAALNDLQENKADTSAVTAVQQSLSGKQDTLVSGTNIKTINNESILGSGNITISGGGGQSLVYYTEDTSNESATIMVQNDDGLNRSEKRVFVDGGDIIIESYNETDDGEGNTGTTDTQVDINSLGLSIITSSDDGIDTTQTQLDVQPMGAYINSEPIATEPYVDAALSGKADTSAVTAVANDVSTLSGAVDDAKAYYISFATLATQGISDDDWDGIVAAIDDHRPIYAGYPRQDGGIIYYGVECMNKNVSNTEIVMTASDNSAHYFYTFTKNGSNDYTFTSETRPYVTDAEKTAWNAKAEPYSAGTGIEISGNVISATGGGGATYSAGYGINIDTANTISFNMPITCTTNTNDNITIGNGANNGSWSLLVGNDMSITNSTGSIGLCVSDMSIGGSSISGNSRGILIGCQNTIKGGNINVGGGVAIGDRNQSTDGGIVIGANSKASGSSTVAIGLSANATGTTKMNLNNQIKVDTNNQIYIKDKTNTTDVCIQDAIAALGGLKLVQCTQAEYSAMEQAGTLDANTLYIVSNVVS